MKLIIQIPCLNEENMLPVTLSDIPKFISGIDAIETLVIDDGSTDRTLEVAKNNGVSHIISFKTHRGLAQAFRAGIEECVRLGADIIVNTDADHQYCGDDIRELITPILDSKADFVIGVRPILEIRDYPKTKKILQYLGSFIVRIISNTRIIDATSGFRAISRNAAMRINIFSNYTYTLETIIQAGIKRLSIVSVPIKINPETRDSRLLKNIPSYVFYSTITIIRIFLLYRPLFLFIPLSILFILIGILALGYNSYISTVLLCTGIIIILIGIISDMNSANRGLLEEIRYVQKQTDTYHHRYE